MSTKCVLGKVTTNRHTGMPLSVPCDVAWCTRYPLEAATCTVIFFGGDWTDAGIAAICGLVAAMVECVIDVLLAQISSPAHAC